MRDCWVSVHQFFELLPEQEIPQQVAAQITTVPWRHILLLLTKCRNDPAKALFYIQKTIEDGWSRTMLENYLDEQLCDFFRLRGHHGFLIACPHQNKNVPDELYQERISRMADFDVFDTYIVRPIDGTDSSSFSMKINERRDYLSPC